MMNLKRSLTTRLQAEPSKGLFWTFLILALIGFADATFLTVEHFMNKVPPCTISGCETVLTSQYSYILGIPVALLGSIYYLSLLVLCFAYLDSKKDVFIRSAFAITFFGIAFSIYFVLVQALIIHAYCQYCLVSAFISTILFIISIIALKKYGQNFNPNNQTI